ncbi:ABC transporter substrate-binding protein [Vallitalea sediminicola]
MRNIKKLLAVVLTICVVLSFTACSKDSSNTSKTEDSSKQSTTDESKEKEQESEKDLPEITFYHGYFQDDWQPAVEMRKIYDEFAKLHKDEFIFKPIAMESGGEGVYNKCTQEIAAGKVPDIVDLGGYNVIPAASQADLIVDLKPYIDEDQEFKKGIGINYQQNNMDGKIYTVRDQLETMGFWYNEDLFNKAGADTPDKWKTWDDFAKAVDKLVESDQVETPFTLSQGWTTNILFTGLMMGSQEGRDMLAENVKDFNNQAFKQALTFLKENALDQVTSEYFVAGDSDKYREDFFTGKAAMLFNGVWESGSFVGDNVTIDVNYIKPAVFPTYEDNQNAAIMSASPGYIIAKNQDKPKIDACIKFVKYMTSKEVADKIFSKVMAMPPSTVVDYKTLEHESQENYVVSNLAFACELAANSKYQIASLGVDWGQDISDAIDGKYAGLKGGSKTAEDIISELNKLLDE